MILAKVLERVVSNAKHPALPNRQYLSVRPFPSFGDSTRPIVVIDGTQAGPGDTVLVLQEGTGARQVIELESSPLPAQMIAVGVVDEIQVAPDFKTSLEC